MLSGLALEIVGDTRSSDKTCSQNSRPELHFTSRTAGDELCAVGPGAGDRGRHRDRVAAQPQGGLWRTAHRRPRALHCLVARLLPPGESAMRNAACARIST